VDVISDEGDHLGPIELAGECFLIICDAGVTSDAVIMAE